MPRVGVEAVDRLHEPHRGDLHEVVERLVGALVAARELARERQEALDQLLARGGVAVLVVAQQQAAVLAGALERSSASSCPAPRGAASSTTGTSSKSLSSFCTCSAVREVSDSISRPIYRELLADAQAEGLARPPHPLIGLSSQSDRCDLRGRATSHFSYPGTWMPSRFLPGPVERGREAVRSVTTRGRRA